MNILNILIFSTLWFHHAFAAHGQDILNYEESSADFVGGTSAANLELQRETLAPLRCEFATGLIVGSRTRELECCNRVVNLYNFQWSTISMSLTTFLETLRQWNCPQYKEQCEKRVFAFTTFSKLIYDYFCNYTIVIETCLPQVLATASAVQQQLNNSLTSNYTALDFKSLSELENKTDYSKIMMWKSLASQIQPSLLSIDELKDPCIEIAQYDVEEVHNGGYQEVINFLVPTCELTWCGFSAETFRDHRISFWTCLRSK